MKSAADIGKWGESVVCEHLRADGWLIAERNWRVGRYEIDLIAVKNGCLRFVEVKTRLADGWTSPEYAITPDKCRALKRAAAAYRAMSRRYANFDFRFDLAAVEYRRDGSYELRYVQGFLESHW